MMEKLNGKSKDIVKENIEKLKNIFPEIFTEEKIDFDKLQETLGSYMEDKEERYDFTWNGKSRARRIAQTPSTGTLRPCKEESVDWDNTENLFIEGDNLEVLKLLQKSYHKKVKMIYIDPPYNTGNDFIYKDDYKDNLKNYLEITGQLDKEGKKLSVNPETGGRYHTNWLNMMYPRLKLARNLLKDDGVIFISIDDNEVHNLIKICDEIFGEENRAGIIHRRKNRKPHNAGLTMSLSYEFILVYYKKDSFKLISEFTSMKSDKKGNYSIYPILQGDKKARIYKFPRGMKVEANNFGKGIIEAKRNSNLDIEILKEPIVKEGILINDIKIKGRFRLTNESGRLDKAFSENRIFINSQGFPKEKRYRKEGDYKVDNHHWDIEAGKNEDGNDEIKKLFRIKSDNYVFQYPKPSNLIKKCINVINDSSMIILDFFSGSGTTAHAVMKTNIEKDCMHKYILVQFPESLEEETKSYKAGYKTIADIGKERIRRVIKKIKSEQEEQNKKNKETLFNDNKDEGKQKLDLGFKVFKLDSSNIKTWNTSIENLEQNLLDSVNNVKSDRSTEDVLYEILLKYGLDLTVPIEEIKISGKKIYSIGYGALIICLENDIQEEVIKGIIKLKNDLKPETIRVVFSDSSFKDDSMKMNAIENLKQNGIEDIKSL
jgi:adenine-specific DNA-methyltransferase